MALEPSNIIELVATGISTLAIIFILRQQIKSQGEQIKSMEGSMKATASHVKAMESNMNAMEKNVAMIEKLTDPEKGMKRIELAERVEEKIALGKARDEYLPRIAELQKKFQQKGESLTEKEKDVSELLVLITIMSLSLPEDKRDKFLTTVLPRTNNLVYQKIGGFSPIELKELKKFSDITMLTFLNLFSQKVKEENKN